MSTHYIDDTVVSMKFDNRDFERNVHQSLGTIDKLKKSLDFKGAADSMEQLSDTIEKTDLSPLLKGLSKATDGFSALEVMAITALSRITNKAMDVGEKLVKSLTVDQLAAGWNKYEQKISAVQTIMAATASTWEENARRIGFAGTQMEFVNEQLEKLNWFSDETSYSFTDMTSNIGKFTSAGVELDKAVTAMEGISVWAAKSGVNARDATRAYYNLAQAISVGSVKLIDWKSIENANMATMEFKQTAIDTAVAMKTLKKVQNGVFETLKGHEVTVKNFNENLKDEWFTSEVLMETLNEYGKAATRLSEIYDTYGIYATEFLSGLEDWRNGNRDIIGIADDVGVSVETLLPLFQELSSEEYALSLSAFKAAQEAKTFTEVLEATKDAVSTQWMNTWELIFGNYEEAKKLWSEMAEKFFDIFAGGGEKRNNILKNLLGDSWDLLVKRIEDAGVAADVFEKKVIEVMDRAGVPTKELLDTWGTLGDVIRNNGFLTKYVRQAITELINPVSEGSSALGEATKKLEDFQKVVNEVIRGNYKSGKQRVENLTKAGWNYAEVQDLVNKVWARNGQTWKDTTITAEDLVDTLGKMSKEELATIGFTEQQVAMLQEFQGELEDTGSDINFFLDSLSNKNTAYKKGGTLIFESLINIVDAFARVISVVKDAWSDVFPTKSLKTLRRYLEIIHSITEWLIMNDETYDKVRRTLRGLFSVMGLVQDLISTVLQALLPDLFAGTEKVGGGILDITAALGDLLYNIRNFLTGGNLLANIIGYLRDMFFASAKGVEVFIEYLSELPIVGAVLNTIAEAIDKIVGFFKELWDIFYDSIIEENKTVFEALVKVFERLADAFKNLEEKYPILKEVKEALEKFFNAFRSYGADILDGLIEGLSGFKLEDLKKKVVELAETIYNTFADWMGIHSPSTKFIELALNCIAGFIVGLIEGTIYVVNAIRNFAKGVSDSTDKYLTDNPNSPMAKLQEYVKIAIEGIRDFFVGVFEGVQRIIQGIGNKLEDAGILKKLSDILKQMMLILWFASIIYKNVGITRAIGRISEAFEGIGDFFESWGLKNYASIARNVAIAIAAVGGIAYLMAKLDTEQFKQAMIAAGVLTVLTGVLSVLFAALTKFNQKVSKAGGVKESGKDKAAKATNKLQLAALILSIGGAVYLIVDSVKKVKEMIGTDITLFNDSMAMVILLLGILVGAIYLINGIMRGVDKVSLLGTAAVVLAMSLSIGIIMDTISKYFFNDGLFRKKIDLNPNTISTFREALASMVILILTMATAVGIMSKIGGKVNMMIGVGSSLIGMSIAINVIANAITSMTSSLLEISKKTKEANNGNDNAALGALAMSLAIIGGLLVALFAGLAILSRAMKDNLTGVVGLIAATVFIAALNFAVVNLINCLKITDDIMSQAKNPTRSIALVAAALIGVVMAVKAINDTHLESKTAIFTLGGIALVIAALGYVTKLLVDQKMPKDVTQIMQQLEGGIAIILVMAGLCNLLSEVASNTTTLYDIFDQIAMYAGIAGVLYVFGEEVAKLANLKMSDDIGYIIGQLKDFMMMLMILGGALIFIQGQWGNSIGTFAVATLLASLGWAIGQLAEGIGALLSALSGDTEWGTKLKGVLQFLFAVLVMIGLFAAGLMLVAAQAKGAATEVAAIIAAVALLILSIAALLAAIVYFDEHENLLDKLESIFGVFKRIYDIIIDVIGKLGEFFGLWKSWEKEKEISADADKAMEAYEYFMKHGKYPDWYTDWSKEAQSKYQIENNAKQIEKDRQLVESGVLNPNRSGSRPVGPNDNTKYNKKYYASGPDRVYGTIEKETSTSNKYLEQIINVGKETNKTLGKYGSQMYLAGAKESEGIFGWPDKIKSFNDIVDTVGKVKEAGLTNPDLWMQVIDEFKSGELSEDSFTFIQNMGEKFGWNFSEAFGNGFSLNTEDIMKNMFDGQSYEEYMKSFGLDNGYLYGQNFMFGMMSAEDEQSAGFMDKASSAIMQAIGKIFGTDASGTDIQGFLSSMPNYDLFSGYGMGGFGMQAVEFPDKMEVTSQSLENFIGNQMNMLRGQVATLKNDINNIYVRLDGNAIVGKLTPSISHEIYGKVTQYGRGN